MRTCLHIASESDSNILETVGKARNVVKFLDDDCSTLAAFDNELNISAIFK